MADNNMAWLREHMREHVARPTSTENVLSSDRALPCSSKNGTSAALDLVYQAAEMIGGIEDRANATEAHARCLVESAMETVNLVESRIQYADSMRRKMIDKANVMLREASKALEQANARIAIAEAQRSAAELRAKTAEERASEAERTLVRIQDAIRTQLLGEGRIAPTNWAEAA